MDTQHIMIGDCRERLKELADSSVDSIVTDPPYELGFMGKKWDSSGIAYDQAVWRECLRVLKPGGHLLAFSGSRTYHRMTCAIEDAGFEVRDQIMWVYGSGFPKSLNVSKAINSHQVFGSSGRMNIRMAAMGGNYCKSDSYAMTGTERSLVNKRTTPPEATTPQSKEAKQWDGWGTALKPAHEPICVARKPLIGTVAENVLLHGTGAINVDGCRVGMEARINTPMGSPENCYGGYSATATATATVGRWPANFIHDGSQEVMDLFPDVKSGEKKVGVIGKNFDNAPTKAFGASGRAPVNHFKANSGSAARFFYCAKASTADRDEGLDGFEEKADTRINAPRECEEDKFSSVRRNNHPTVKPTALMRYLCRLVTQPNGLILDPFAGSGSTGKAAMLEGFRFVGCELSPEYAAIAEARITQAGQRY